ncbi:MAG: hypothetical protein KAI76_08900 [Alphaproteobacteria bacterium]|nr:hypothetical protein [Alphaproteobacteria bacterium]MCK5658676.1 hypothetical protein [Alphaproteobacteria bacterium]
MSPFINLFFDIALLTALGVTVFYCFRLSRQFTQMRADRKAFEILIQSLNVASAKADASIKSFRETAVGSGDSLQEKINRSRALSDELEIMIQAGDDLANRLQSLAEKSRKVVTNKNSIEASKLDIQPRTRAEKDLLEVIRTKQQS